MANTPTNKSNTTITKAKMPSVENNIPKVVSVPKVEPVVQPVVKEVPVVPVVKEAPITTTSRLSFTPTPSIDIDALQKQVAFLQESLTMLTQIRNQAQPQTQTTQETYSPFEAKIPIMSLYYGVLNLKTDNTGNPNIVTWSRYGEILPLSSIEVSNILKYNKSFAEKGYFYILDQKAVDDNFFSIQHKRLLPDTVISTITQYNELQIPKVLANVTDVQKDTIAHLLADRVAAKDPEIDLNKVAVVAKYVGKDIMGMARDIDKILNPSKYQNNEDDEEDDE